MTTYSHSIAATDLDPVLPGARIDVSPWHPVVETRRQRKARVALRRKTLAWRAVAYLLAAFAIVGGIQVVWQAVGTDIYMVARQAYLHRTTPAIPVDENPTFTMPERVEAAPALRGAPTNQHGDVVGRIVIDKIDMDWLLIYGVDKADLKDGPGWMPHTSFPGEPGNAVLSGHRTTYGAPFNRIDELVPGDVIKIAVEGRTTATYEVTDSFLVTPDDTWVADPSDGAMLTLTTCAPEGSSTQRLIVKARLVSGEFASYALASS